MKNGFIFISMVLPLLLCGNAMAADEAVIQELQTDVTVTKSKADKNSVEIQNMKGGLPAEAAAREAADAALQEQINNIQLLPGPQGESGAAGADGTSCTVVQGDGMATITCTDGTVATVNDGTDGAPGEPGAQGQAGTNGLSCTVTQNNGSATIVCEDGTTATVQDGTPGEPGTPGQDGTSCTVIQNNGSATISCTDGTTATVSDGADGAQGPPGADGEQGPPGADGSDVLQELCDLYELTANPFPLKCFNCGNGTIEPMEECDDGNTNDSDGCSSTCIVEVEGRCVELCEAYYAGDTWVCNTNYVTMNGICDDNYDICLSEASFEEDILLCQNEHDQCLSNVLNEVRICLDNAETDHENCLLSCGAL